jgi:hypothetical protein
MAITNKEFDSVGGFSISNTQVANEFRDFKNLNTLELKNRFHSDSKTTNYILRGLNTTSLQIDDIGSGIPIENSTVNFITGNILAVNPSGTVYSLKIESTVGCNSLGNVSVLSSLTTIIKDDIPNGESWTVSPQGSTNNFTYNTGRTGTVQNIKWVASTQVVSIDWA